jgi:hypothetical protein
MELPPNFVDPFPDRGPWRDPATPPAPYLSAEVVLPDGKRTSATWTGKLWWTREEIHPIGWRPGQPGHST